MSAGRWWVISGVFSLACLALLLHMWNRPRNPPHDPGAGPALTRAAEVDDYLDGWRAKRGALRTVPTGVFVQSLRFLSATDVHLTGYVWQKYRKGDGITRGFTFPEQVDALAAVEVKSREPVTTDDGHEVHTTYFEATLRQKFDYAHYPFDHKTVWLRFWANDWSPDVLLVPDLESYDDTAEGTVFGIESGIVLGTWDIDETYFNYASATYDTDFGLEDETREWPEFRFNLVINRRSVNALVVNMLPLFVVAVLLFGALLTLASDEEDREVHGFSTSTMIGTCSALFFVVMLAHIRLREQFAGTKIVYLEYFYFFMYAVLLLVAVNTYVFSSKSQPALRFIHHRDNLMIKLAYWPFVLGGMATLTWIALQ